MSNKLDILNIKGECVGSYEIPSEAIELGKGEQAVHDCVVAFQSSIRANSAHTKTRGEVSGGGAKPFRQKGLGRGRAGSSRSPVWVGGGVIFGPRNERNYIKKVNRKVAKLALKRAFSERVVDGSIIVVDALNFPDHKTRNAAAMLKALKADRTVLIAVPEYEETVVCATGNLANAILRRSASINVYEMLRFHKFVFTKDALDAFIERLV